MIALGFRAHTGWAAGVALQGPVSAPEIVDRRRIQLAAIPTYRFVFHAAAEMTLAAAERHVRKARESAAAMAREAVAAYVKDVGARRCGVIMSNGTLPGELEKILASHALLHAAEGQLFRQVIADAAEAEGLELVGVPARGLRELAAATLGDEVDEELAELGRRAGKPWALDQKESSLVAWIALARRAR